MRRDIYQAIADPTRRGILSLLLLGSMTPNALAEYFDITRQGVSNHLKILAECELVKQEQLGREIYYSLEVQRMKEIDQWLDQFRQVWQQQFSKLDDVLKTMKKNKK